VNEILTEAPETPLHGREVERVRERPEAPAHEIDALRRGKAAFAFELAGAVPQLPEPNAAPVLAAVPGNEVGSPLHEPK
jgi:hypothetical protein